MENKLFHTLVIMGATLTGGVATVTCGGSSDGGSLSSDAGRGSDSVDDSYAHIGIFADQYANISPPPLGHDAATNGDADLVDAADGDAPYPNIGPPPRPDSG
jgi:hypothetical protein